MQRTVGDRCLQAVLVLGLNGVGLLNKEQVVDHDDKGADVNKRRRRGAGRVSTAWTSVAAAATIPSLNAPSTCEGLLAPLMPATPAARSTMPLATKHDRGEHGVGPVRGIEAALGDADPGDDEAGDAQNEVDEGQGF